MVSGTICTSKCFFLNCGGFINSRVWMWLKRQRFMSFGKLPNMRNGFPSHSASKMHTHLLASLLPELTSFFSSFRFSSAFGGQQHFLWREIWLCLALKFQRKDFFLKAYVLNLACCVSFFPVFLSGIDLVTLTGRWCITKVVTGGKTAVCSLYHMLTIENLMRYIAWLFILICVLYYIWY